MLEELHVRDLALIEEAWLEFGSGMTVLTGETGAGKTALLGALKLLVGERADSAAVRSGARETLVEGRFSAGGAEIVARRRVSADGRSRCALDGEIATVSAIADRLGPLVDLHGQHEHQALLSASTHSGYLDRWAGEKAAGALLAYSVAREAWRAAIRSRDELTAQLAEVARDSDYLRFVAEEIDRVDPQPGEDAVLEARLPQLQHAERLAEAADEASRLLRGDGGALDQLAEASAALGRVDGIDPLLDGIAARLAEVEALVDDAGTSARQYRDGVEHDPAALEATLSRLSALSGLAKKYGPRLEDVSATRDKAATALAVAVDGVEALAAAEQLVGAAEGELRKAAGELERLRTAAAPGFSAALGEATSELEMGGARFEVAFSELEFAAWTADGPQRLEFLYAPAPGQPARPLARIASGGELSRVMLALKSVLGSADTVGTLVFDEVDAGIGGATATAVGRRLASLASTHQVIVVTHLAQVAAFADTHLVVRKVVESDGAATTVVPVEGADRVAEIARMLSGAGSDAGLAHARELLEAAGRSR